MQNPIELINELILFIGENATEFNTPGNLQKFQKGKQLNDPSAHSIRDFLVTEGFANTGPIRIRNQRIESQPYLTFKGWERYYELISGPTQSKLAFMAMRFGNNDNGGEDYKVERAYRECFTKAVEKTGYKLQKVNEGQPSGNIDEHIIVRIRSARFIIADLTDHNNGVYWEAGFAEGLGKPVIYTCNE